MISFVYSTPKPWNWCRMCILGIFTLHDKNMWQLLIGLYFLAIGIQIEWGNNDKSADGGKNGM